MKIHMAGDFLTHSSYAKTNREIARRLSRYHSLSLSKDTSGFPAAVRDSEVEALIGRFDVGSADVVLRRHWPPDFSPARNLIVSLHWEYGRFPSRWVEEAAENCSQVWHSSRTEGEAWLNGGFPEGALRWAPLGFDPAVYYPAENASERKEWLYVGGLIWRKGADLAIRAFSEAFRDKDERLRLHCYGNDTYYCGQDLSDGESGVVNENPYVYITRGLLSEREMGDLYRSAKALLAPSRGEGFGLPQLEAVACGTPVIATEGSAPFDFLKQIEGAQWVGIPAYRAPLFLSAEHTAPGQFFLEPDYPFLTDALASFDKEASSSVDASEWTWDAAVDVMREHLRDFA